MNLIENIRIEEENYSSGSLQSSQRRTQVSVFKNCAPGGGSSVGGMGYKGLKACVHPPEAEGLRDSCTVRELHRKKRNVSCRCVVGWDFEESNSSKCWKHFVLCTVL